MQLTNVFIKRNLFMIIYWQFTARRFGLKQLKKKRRQDRDLRQIMTLSKRVLIASQKPFRVVDLLDMIMLQVKSNPDTITTMVYFLLNLLVVGRAIKIILSQLLGCYMSYPPSCKTHWFLQEKDNQMEIAKPLKRHVNIRHK